MKLEYLLFCISLFFSLVGLLLKDVAPAGQMIISVFKYVPLLLLYFRNLRKDFSCFLPVLYTLLLIALSFIGGQPYGIAGMLVVIMVPVSLYVFNRITFTRKQIQIIQWMLSLAFIGYVLLSFVFRSRLNPNQVGFTYLILFLDIFICAYTNGKGSSNKVFYITLGLITFLLILFTRSRTSLLVFLMIPVAFFFRKKVKNMGLILWVILILYLVYPFVYCLLAGDTALRASHDTMMMDQDIFSGREIIWSYVITELTNPSVFWFGGIDTEWWGKSMHNSAIDIIARYGIPTLIMMYAVIVHYFKRATTLINNKYKSLLVLVLVTMIWGANESGMLLGFSFFLFLPYCILHSKNYSR